MWHKSNILLVNKGDLQLIEGVPLVMIKPVNTKGNQPWILAGRTDAEVANTLATWCEELTHWKRLWYWKGLEAGGEEDKRGWDGWMASPTRWAWVWVNSGNWWWTGSPGVLGFMGSQRVGQDWATELNWTEHFTWFPWLATFCQIYLYHLPSATPPAPSLFACLFVHWIALKTIIQQLFFYLLNAFLYISY